MYLTWSLSYPFIYPKLQAQTQNEIPSQANALNSSFIPKVLNHTSQLQVVRDHISGQLIPDFINILLTIYRDMAASPPPLEQFKITTYIKIMSYNVSYVILKLFKTLIFMMTNFGLPFQQMISQCPQLCLSCIASHNTRTLCHLVVLEYPKKNNDSHAS